MTRQVCSVCVMDAVVPAITFDEAGQCVCCRDAFARRAHEWWPDAEGERKLGIMLRGLRQAGKGKPYDAMIGLSGGIDSAYLAHLAVRQWGLRVLAVHIDGGWNSEPAVSNIESLVRALDLDLFTHVIEWGEMRDLQLSFLRASVLNQDIPQDHAFFATLYRTAKRFGIRDFLSGVNFASESISPPSWGFPSMDGRHVRGVHRRFGVAPLLRYPVMPLPEYFWLTRVRRQLQLHRPLNYLAYDKTEAQETLRREYGWRDYGAKHCESRFTKFYQEIFLARKFGFDKRRLHLSSLIVSGQLSREQALSELEQPLLSADQERRDLRFVAKKLGITPAELTALIEAPAVDHLEYPSDIAIQRAFSSAKRIFRSLIFRGVNR